MTKYVDFIAWLLVVVGAINWGLVGAFNFNVVSAVFGGIPMVVTVTYMLVALSGVYFVYQKFKG